jgi:tripartite-type tricarboxylate transporter receptor subunit TctC
LVIYPTLHSNVQYDPYRDFVPIAITTELPFVLVVPSSTPIRNMADWVSYFRANSDRSTYASWGPASPAHILGEMLAGDAKLDLVHVPYKGEAPAVVDLLGGQVSMMFLTSATALPHIKEGKLRALGVTGPRRLPSLPDVPTLQESGFASVNLTGWFAVVVPAGTSQEIVTRLHTEIVEVLKSPAFTQLAAAQSGIVVASTPAEVIKRIRTESSSIKKLVEVTKLKLDE